MPAEASGFLKYCVLAERRTTKTPHAAVYRPPEREERGTAVGSCTCMSLSRSGRKTHSNVHTAPPDTHRCRGRFSGIQRAKAERTTPGWARKATSHEVATAPGSRLVSVAVSGAAKDASPAPRQCICGLHSQPVVWCSTTAQLSAGNILTRCF